MDKRLGQLAGLLAFTMVILRLNRLIESGPDTRWQLILMAAAVLGGVVWWLLRQLITNRIISWALFALGGLILFLRISVPQTLTAGFVPTAETYEALATTMGEAMRYIRNGVPPIDPVVGVIAILAALMWLVGALFVWGSGSGPVAAIFVPSTILYLQFAVFDRAYAGLGWMGVSAVLLTVGVVALAMERRTDSGRARDREGRPMPRRSPTLAVVIGTVISVGAVIAATSASGLVSEYGNLPWRTGTGYGLGGGGTRFDRFVDLQQQLVSLSDVVLFKATTDDLPAGESIYWRLETLDDFDGVSWTRSSITTRDYEPGLPIGNTDHSYRGETAEILQFVQIEALRGPIAPSAGVPLEIHPRDLDGVIQPRSFDVLADSALVYTPELYEGDRYQVLSAYPMSNADLGMLATGPDGELTPIFANAAEAGEFDGEPALPVTTVEPPSDLEFYTRLPEGRPSALRGQAVFQTLGASSDFERAWMLESWFQSGAFEYRTDVSTGHSALNLADWLADTTSTNYRTGYCEQFATAMAVLGRELGIPSRVVRGFTPGTTITEVNADGAEVDVIEVRGTNAHAWVEMWVEPVGWVKFDPTPRGAFVDPTSDFDPTEFIPEDEAADQNPNNNAIPLPDAGFDFLEQEPTEFTQVQQVDWWLVAIPVLIILLLTVPVFKRLRRRRRLARIRDGGDITAAWDEIVDRLTDLGRPVSPSSTPMEVAEGTNPALVPIAATYSAAIYGGHEGAARESDLMAVEIWLHERFDAADRMKASFSARSLLKR